MHVTSLLSGRTARLKQLLDSINTQTSKLYEPLLQRKHESDRIRSVLDVLSRYRFLFDLPGSLKTNIAKQQYDKVGTACVCHVCACGMCVHVSVCARL